jgi:hypothetical protein
VIAGRLAWSQFELVLARRHGAIISFSGLISSACIHSMKHHERTARTTLIHRGNIYVQTGPKGPQHGTCFILPSTAFQFSTPLSPSLSSPPRLQEQQTDGGSLWMVRQED